MQPYPHQLEALAAIAQARAAGKRRALLVMASGLGKTLTAAWELQEVLKKDPNARVLVLCHQSEILDQNQKRFRTVLGDDLDMGIYYGARRELSPQVRLRPA